MSQINNADDLALRGFLPSVVSPNPTLGGQGIGGRGGRGGRVDAGDRDTFDFDELEQNTVDALADEQDEAAASEGESGAGVAAGGSRGLGAAGFNAYEQNQEPPPFRGNFENQPNVSAGFASFSYRVQNEPTLSFGALGGNLDLVG
ncbi:hypothetical protein [Acanthopleuribacter pedis]|uniref:Uncharacterized protein n=1 Tax=Acanthopleuribacter pedis TaxID=442870 RepID=A0A8J7Q597_9BACT|nr:hypothetical protein [Acanthopleuribacter pedis]MBO1318166.1 hypothetical protein [Acanthopleuribacter pedis]